MLFDTIAAVSTPKGKVLGKTCVKKKVEKYNFYFYNKGFVRSSF